MLITTVAALILAPPAIKEVTFKVEGVERRALAHTPAKTTNAPLVFIWHGHGGSAEHSSRAYSIHTEWPEAVVLYMHGLPTPGMTDPEGLKRGWQRARLDQGDRDLKLYDAALAWAKKEYGIDPKRVYSGGHSNGGAFTYLLWATRHETLAAVAPSAAVFGRNALEAKPLPALIIAGEKDELVKFDFQMRSLRYVFNLNRCSSVGTPAGEMMKMHKAEAGGADVLTYIYPGGHTMPTDTGKKMVAFFRQHKRS